MNTKKTEEIYMAVSNSKLRTLYIMKILMERTDEQHVMSSADLEKALAAYGLTADRKTIYSDVETLQEFGLDILQVRGGVKQGWYIGARDFELPELKLLVDAVQSSKFITEKKSMELISKIEKLAGENDARHLQRDVYIINRIKAGNETIYYNVDSIHEAILSNRRIMFHYTEWNMNKELVFRKNGEYYEVSPWAVTWDDENYYLIAYEEASGLIKHYRVDKMKDVLVMESERSGKEKFDDFDLASYAKKTFGMYGGRDESVSLICDRDLAGVMIDRFGRDVMLIPEDEGHFTVSVTVSVSPQFFGWLTGLGDGVRISGPEKVRKEYVEFVHDIIKAYKD